MKLEYRCRHSSPVIVVALFAVQFVGCTGEKFSRHVVRGKVTYDGKPVDYGAITFEPDESIGQLAPTTSARVENGVYETIAKDSPTKGKYKVRVLGYDKAKMKTDVVPGEIVVTPQLFPEYSMPVEIPTPDGRLDIEVPTAAARKK